MLHVPRKRKASSSTDHNAENGHDSDGNDTDEEDSSAYVHHRKRPLWESGVSLFASAERYGPFHAPFVSSSSSHPAREPVRSVRQQQQTDNEEEQDAQELKRSQDNRQDDANDVEDNPVANYEQAPLPYLEWIDRCEELDKLLECEGAVSERGYCYLCCQKLPDDHPFILIIRREMADLHKISLQTLCEMIQGLYNAFIGPTLPVKRNYLLRDIYAHITNHEVLPLTTLVNQQRIVNSLSEEYAKRALTRDPDNPDQRLPMNNRDTQVAVNLARTSVTIANAINSIMRQDRRGRI